MGGQTQLQSAHRVPAPSRHGCRKHLERWRGQLPWGLGQAWVVGCLPRSPSPSVRSFRGSWTHAPQVSAACSRQTRPEARPSPTRAAWRRWPGQPVRLQRGAPAPGARTPQAHVWERLGAEDRAVAPSCCARAGSPPNTQGGPKPWIGLGESGCWRRTRTPGILGPRCSNVPSTCLHGAGAGLDPATCFPPAGSRARH